ncbi:VOC family protein [Staphylococcus xylosus]|uniref:VOC family protein n=1 Tax=Staphylococcus xylosus TaxID=1288 RepID=UPI003F5561F9
MTHQKIVPHLWFDTEAKKAFDFYKNIFPETNLITEVTLKDTPSGDANQLIFDIYGFRFMAINAGPYFVKNPSISFTVLFKQSETDLLENIYQKLIENGRAIMPLAQYDFSEKYGWVQDQFDVSWQISPKQMGEMISKGTPEQIKRVTEAFLKMKKIDIMTLEQAFDNE